LELFTLDFLGPNAEAKEQTKLPPMPTLAHRRAATPVTHAWCVARPWQKKIYGPKPWKAGLVRSFGDEHPLEQCSKLLLI